MFSIDLFRPATFSLSRKQKGGDIMPMKGVQSSKGRKAPRTFFFVDGIEEPPTELHMSGLGGKSGRRGGSERKKKHIPPHIPPQALFPQPPPSSDSTHTPQTHPHLPHLPECSRKGSTQQSQVWSSGTAAVGSFVDKGSNGGPLGMLGVGIYQRQSHFL